jgi:hypothetical protein
VGGLHSAPVYRHAAGMDVLSARSDLLDFNPKVHDAIRANLLPAARTYLEVSAAVSKFRFALIANFDFNRLCLFHNLNLYFLSARAPRLLMYVGRGGQPKP